MGYQSRPDQGLNRSTIRNRPSVRSRSFPLPIVARGITVALFFGITFAIDQLTGQRYSVVLGSAAIVGSVLSVFPAIRPTAIALGGYGAIWLGFNLARAAADDAGLAVAGQTFVASIEASAFGGSLPSEWLQNRFYDPGNIQAHDIVLALIHASFFITPFILAVALWRKRRAVFYRYSWATAIAFGLGLAGFVLLPTAPPWLGEPGEVTRVTIHVLAALSPGDGGSAGTIGGPVTEEPRLGFEPNHVAALPSVHVAAAVLVFLAMRHAPVRLSLLGIAYAMAMTVAVVYLGEHYVLDALLGWAAALIGWRVAQRFASRATPD